MSFLQGNTMNFSFFFKFIFSFSLISLVSALDDFNVDKNIHKFASTLSSSDIDHESQIDNDDSILLNVFNKHDQTSENDFESDNHVTVLLEDSNIIPVSNNNDEPDLLANFLYMLNLKIQDVSNHNERAIIKWTRISAKSLAVILGLTAGIPFFQPACTASLHSPILPGNDFLCYTFGIGTVIAYGGLVSWAGLRLTDRIRSYKFDEEMLGKKIISEKNGVLGHLISNVSGLFACIPGTYLVYKYNSIKWFVIPTILVDYILRTEGYYTFLNKIKSIKLCSKQIPKNTNYSFQIKQYLAKNVYKMLSDGELSNNEIQENSLKFIRDLLTSNSNEESIPIEMEYGRIALIIRKATQYGSLIFPLATEIVRIQLTNKAISNFIDSLYIRIPIALLISIPGFSLNTLASTKSVGNLFDNIYKKIYSKSQPTFMSYFYPKYNYLIYSISMFLALLSITGDAFVAFDTTSDSDFSYLKYLLPVLIATNNFLYESFAISGLCQDISIEAIKKFGAGRLKIGVNIMRAYEFAGNIVEKVNFSNFQERTQTLSNND